MGASLLTVTGADTVKPTLNPFEKLSPQKKKGQKTSDEL